MCPEVYTVTSYHTTGTLRSGHTDTHILTSKQKQFQETGHAPACSWCMSGLIKSLTVKDFGGKKLADLATEAKKALANSINIT